MDEMGTYPSTTRTYTHLGVGKDLQLVRLGDVCRCNATHDVVGLHGGVHAVDAVL